MDLRRVEKQVEALVPARRFEPTSKEYVRKDTYCRPVFNQERTPVGPAPCLNAGRVWPLLAETQEEFHPRYLPAVTTSTWAAAAPISVSEVRRARLSLAYLDVSTLQFRVVESAYRVGDLLSGRHLDKAETLRLSGEFIRYHCGALYLTCLGEELL